MGILTSNLILNGCVGTRYVTGKIDGYAISINEDVFLNKRRNYLKYVIVQNDVLQYPVVVFRLDHNDYKALLMKCTHQGTELQVFGDRLQCPAHGSEFANTGEVQNGPADSALRNFPVIKEFKTLKIDLS